MIKILFINEYFPPYAPGGGEWSTFYLANDLAKRNLAEVVVVTPSYGNKSIKVEEKVRVEKFPFFGKLNSEKKILSSIYHTNFIWYLTEAFFICKFAIKHNVDLLHVHGKYSIPGARIASFVLRKPILITVRDYMIVCNYGLCLFKGDKPCSTVDYFRNDFATYYRCYINAKNPINLFTNLIFAIFGRINRNVIRYFALDLDTVVLSKKQKQIFVNSGFKKVKVIYNSIDFIENLKEKRRKRIVLFAGRLTFGKGAGLLINIIPEFFRENPGYLFYFIGDGPYKKELQKLSKRYPGLRVLGNIEHKKLMSIYQQARVTVVPSLWPEPFGRIALESLSRLTPTVVTNRGGLREIVENERWGYVIEPSEENMLEAIKNAILNFDTLTKNISNDFELIKKKFGRDVSNQYLKHYNTLINK